MTFNYRKSVSYFLVSICVFIFSACVTSEAPPARAKIRPTPVSLPIMNSKAAQLVQLTAADEKRMTLQILPDVQKDYPPLKDSFVQDYVTQLGQRLVGASGFMHDYEFTFTVVKSIKINSFSLPGGAVFVTTGLIGLMGSEAELAGVIGHEIGHVKSRDAALRLEESRDTEGRLDWYVPGGGIPNEVEAFRPGIGGPGLLVQKYYFMDHTPEQEIAADKFGYMAALNANFNKEYIGLFFSRLFKINNDTKTLGVLADAVMSHQPSSARIAQLQLLAVESPAPKEQALVSGTNFKIVQTACKDANKRPAK